MDQAIDDRPTPTSTDQTQSMTERVAPLLLVAASVFAIDQITKAIIRSWLSVGTYWPSDFELIRISHVENEGAAFGTLQGAGPLLIITTGVAIVLIALTMLRSESYPRSHLYALALILGGAIGNRDQILQAFLLDLERAQIVEMVQGEGAAFPGHPAGVLQAKVEIVRHAFGFPVSLRGVGGWCAAGAAAW